MSNKRQLTLILLSALMAACGGGGGGGTPAPAPAPAPAPSGCASVAPTTPTGGNVTLSGLASYASVPNTATGALNYALASDKPIRGATLEVLDSGGGVLATTQTGADGRYAVAVPGGVVMSMRVRAELLKSGSGPTWNVTVRDNTAVNALYSIQGCSFATGAAAITRDINAPTGWNGSAYSGTRAAAPFAVLDAVYAAQAKVLSAEAAAQFPLLQVYWSPNNFPASGSLTAGQIGTTFFTQSGSTRQIYVLGAADSDTDEFDSSVIAHEWGHYYQSAFSRDDSIGGSHSGSSYLDRRVAFSEGWGNAFSGIALERSTYTDSSGPGQSSGFSVNLDNPVASGAGWFREYSVQYVLWKLNQSVGFAGIHAAMKAMATTPAMTGIHAFATAYNTVAAATYSTLNSLLIGQMITASSTDPFGPTESNSGGVAAAVPLYRTMSGPPLTATNLCVANTSDPGVPANRLGRFVYVRVTLAAGTRSFTATTTTSGGTTDPDLFVYQNGNLFARFDSVGSTQTGTATLNAGEHVIALTDFNNNNNACFTLTIN